MRKGKPVVDFDTTNELWSPFGSNLSPLANPKGNVKAKRNRN